MTEDKKDPRDIDLAFHQLREAVAGSIHVHAKYSQQPGERMIERWLVSVIRHGTAHEWGGDTLDVAVRRALEDLVSDKLSDKLKSDKARLA